MITSKYKCIQITLYRQVKAGTRISHTKKAQNAYKRIKTKKTAFFKCIKTSKREKAACLAFHSFLRFYAFCAFYAFYVCEIFL